MTTSPPQLTMLHRDIMAAVMILTRIPVDWPDQADAPDTARSYWAFPLVGVGVAAIPALAGAGLVELGVPPLAAAALALFGVMLMTGGLHHDGLADVTDSLGGRDRERRLAIMHDSAIGSFGTLGLITILIICTSCLAHLARIDPLLMAAGLIATSAMSRAMMALQRWHRPTPTDSGLASATGRPSTPVMVMAMMLGLLAGLVFLSTSGAFVAMALGVITTILFGMFMMRWVGGVNGDGLGASQQLSEAIMLMALTLMV
ncbi:MAG: adenosylcobinamide-GDP ribazoletransferase [Alphaproteobacteria bacterium]|nr:adenosylcobinamide-GDP ribazoletransferase [Alphaproteobacteria bacterium]